MLAAVLFLGITIAPPTARAQDPELAGANPALTASPPYTSAVILPDSVDTAPLDTTTAVLPDRWKTELDLGFTSASGNQQLLVLTSGARLTYLQTEQFEFELRGDMRYGRSEGEEVARNLKGGIQIDLQSTGAWSPFAFATAEQDPFQRLTLRLNSGGGAEYTFTESADSEVSLSLATLYSYENIEGEAELPARPSRNSARWSLRFQGRRDLNSAMELDQTTFYQPIWDQPGDYLFHAETSLDVKMTESVALRLSHTYDRNSTPPQGVGKDDTLVRAGLSIEI